MHLCLILVTSTNCVAVFEKAKALDPGNLLITTSVGAYTFHYLQYNFAFSSSLKM